MSPPEHIVTDGADLDSSFARTKSTVVRGWDTGCTILESRRGSQATRGVKAPYALEDRGAADRIRRNRCPCSCQCRRGIPLLLAEADCPHGRHVTGGGIKTSGSVPLLDRAHLKTHSEHNDPYAGLGRTRDTASGFPDGRLCSLCELVAHAGIDGSRERVRWVRVAKRRGSPGYVAWERDPRRPLEDDRRRQFIGVGSREP